MPPKPDENTAALWQQLADAQSSLIHVKIGESIMANVTVTFTITEFCLHTGISEEELNEIVGLGWLNRVRSVKQRVFDDHAAIVVQRAVRLRHELALDWHGIAVALTLMDDIAHLKQENRLLRQRLSRFVTHP
ncbi:chaperone modulator CbpM [Escherichia coli]|uniref:chaperone modulator CbpM n=1 Tax=Escherichia coli TaxID=562 RepID=UPI0039E0E3D8